MGHWTENNVDRSVLPCLFFFPHAFAVLPNHYYDYFCFHCLVLSLLLRSTIFINVFSVLKYVMLEETFKAGKVISSLLSHHHSWESKVNSEKVTDAGNVAFKDISSQNSSDSIFFQLPRGHNSRVWMFLHTRNGLELEKLQFTSMYDSSLLTNRK